MIYTSKIQKAIKFSIKTHEVYQKQKRKGKDIPYIVHPLTTGIILASVKASEDVIIAGILHDTIEDSIPEKKVTKKMLIERFGKKVADLVESVTEKNKELPWEERKKEALMHIKNFSHDLLLIKSADIISNATELIEDFEKNGDETFSRFNAPKEKTILNYLKLIRTIIECWADNPLAKDLIFIAKQLQMIGNAFFMSSYPEIVIEYKDYNKNKKLECPLCGWHGKTHPNIESDLVIDVTCPICDKILLVANFSFCY